MIGAIFIISDTIGTFVLTDRCFDSMFIFYLITCLNANFYSLTTTAIAWYSNRAHFKEKMFAIFMASEIVEASFACSTLVVSTCYIH